MNTKPLTFLSLFAGIGGLDLGLERAGMRCIGQVEIDPFCRKVLAKHWPGVPKFDDVRTFNAGMLDEKPDLICGGFPCQGISTANPSRTGLADRRSGLWSEFRRVIGDVEPSLVIVENVSNLAFLGLDRVLGNFSDLGFNTEWARVPASLVGSPQNRSRLFIIAHAMRERWPVLLHSHAGALAEAAPWGKWQTHPSDSPCDVLQAVEKECGQPSVLGGRDGLPAELDCNRRLCAIGNAVVPQVAEYIGRLIVEAHANTLALGASCA